LTHTINVLCLNEQTISSIGHGKHDNGTMTYFFNVFNVCWPGLQIVNYAPRSFCTINVTLMSVIIRNRELSLALKRNRIGAQYNSLYLVIPLYSKPTEANV